MGKPAKPSECHMARVRFLHVSCWKTLLVAIATLANHSHHLGEHWNQSIFKAAVTFLTKAAPSDNSPGKRHRCV